MNVVITIVEFKNHMKARGYAEGTINEYIRCLNKFKAYLKEHNIDDLRKVTRQVIFDYRIKVMSEPFAMETKATRIRAIKRLFEYLTSDHKLLINPAEGKGKKQRVVPLSKGAVKYLKEYLEKIRPWHGRKNPKERSLFLNNSGLPLKKGSVQSFMRKYRIEAGIKKPVSPHTFRRTCATHLLQQGADIRYIQKLLGHRRLSTTQLYTKVIPVDVKEIHNKTHPNIRGQRG